jgi:hypothetical protein
MHNAEACRLPCPGPWVGCSGVEEYVPVETPNPVLMDYFSARKALALILQAESGTPCFRHSINANSMTILL